MLLDEFIPDSDISKDYDQEDKHINEFSDTQEMKEEESDDDDKCASDDSANDVRTVTTNKIVLPHELEELVKEALAELKTIN